MSGVTGSRNAHCYACQSLSRALAPRIAALLCAGACRANIWNLQGRPAHRSSWAGITRTALQRGGFSADARGSSERPRLWLCRLPTEPRCGNPPIQNDQTKCAAVDGTTRRLVRLGIGGVNSIRLMKIASRASPREVFQIGRSALRLWNDVLQMERRPLQPLVHETVLAAFQRPLLDKRGQFVARHVGRVPST